MFETVLAMQYLKLLSSSLLKIVCGAKCSTFFLRPLQLEENIVGIQALTLNTLSKQ